MKLAFVLLALCLAFGVAHAAIFTAGNNEVDEGWVIRFKPNVDSAVRTQHMTHELLNGATIVREYTFNQGRFQAYAVTGLDLQTVIALHELPEVMDVSPNVRVSLHDEDLHVQSCRRTDSTSWGLSRTVHFGPLPTDLPIEKVPYQFDTDGCGRGIELHVFDTGVYLEHKDFGGRARLGIDATDDNNGGTDGHGHGTHVASTAAGSTYGLARCAEIVAVKVLNAEGAGNLFGILAGIEYSVGEAEKGKRIVANFSLGALRNDLLNQIVTNAVEAGILVVAAAGNSNENAEYFSPASATGVFTVAATTKEDVRSEFSNWGPIVDVFAPGSLITGAWIGAPDAERTVSGTSMACPHGSGVAVKVWSQNPRFSNAQVMEHMIRASNPNVIRDPKDTPNRLLFDACRS